MSRDIPLVGVSLSPYVQPNTDWYARSVLKSNANTPTSTTPASLFKSISGRTYAFKTKRGRTYDLGRTEAGMLDLRVDNSDGALNPLNSVNNLYPFCPARVTAAYPTTGNILNDTNKGYIGEVTAVVTGATGASGVVTYTANNTFQIGQQVSVTGLTVTALNLSAQIVTGASLTSFTVANAATGTATAQVGTASLDLPATWADSSVSVCANDATFELGVISNWYSFTGSSLSINTSSGHSGSKSLQIASSASAWLDVPCVAGQNVTFSVWVKSFTSATTGSITIYPDSYADGSSASTNASFVTTGSWARYSVTATATAPKITIQISSGTNNLLVDDVQVEFGSTATANTTTGSTVYNLFNGFVERFPQSFQAPNRGEVNMTATDAVALMSQNTLINPYSAIATLNADTYLYYPFNESDNISVDVYSSVYSSGAGTITYRALNSFIVGDVVTVTGMGANNVDNASVIETDGITFKVYGTGSGTIYGAGVASATRVYSQSGNAYANTTANGWTTGNGVITLGENNNLAGFNGDTNINVTTTSATDNAYIFGVLPAGAVSAVGSSFMVDVWVKWNRAGDFLWLNHNTGSTITKVGVTSGGFLTVTRTGAGGGTVTQSGSNNIFQANVWRLVRVYFSGTRLFIGMADYDSTTATSVYGFTFSPLTVPATNVNSFFLGMIGNAFKGSFAALRFGKYNALNQGQSISKNLFQLGWTGYSGAKTGSRFADVMQNYSGFNYTPIASDLGINHSGAINLATRTLQDVVQVASDTEQGYWYVDGSGFVTFKDQTHREYTTPNVPVVKFSDNATDIQYVGESIVVNYDLTFVYNQVTVTCSGATFYAEDATSINRYFPRTLSMATENAYPTEVSALASNLLAKYKDPKGRLETITFTPARNPANWNALLGLEIGDFVQVTRTPLGSTAITFKGWVETIEHDFDAQTGDWVMNVNVSPHLPTS